MTNGKGDTPRPLSVPTQTFAERWAATFGAQPQRGADATQHSGNTAERLDARGERS